MCVRIFLLDTPYYVSREVCFSTPGFQLSRQVFFFAAPQAQQVQSSTLSTIIDEFAISMIDFLGIDTEGDEGLQRSITRLFDRSQPLLTQYGFRVLADVGIANVEGVNSNIFYTFRK